MIDPIRPGGPLPLDTFRETARQGESVEVTVDGQGYKVVAQGQLGTGSGTRDVSWVQGGVDTTQMFVDSLGASVGSGLTDVIARELGLAPAPGKPLSSRTVERALDMAQTGQQALAGVDFLTQMDCSARARGAGFGTVLSSLGIDGQRLDDTQRARIDERMQARFAQAAAAGQSPVSSETARGWLREEILALGLEA